MQFKLSDNQSEIRGMEISPVSIISKISLLTLNFPKLQIIWSKGPSHTANIFKQLKNTQTGLQRDPDLQKIARIGKVGSLENDAMED